MNEDLLKRLGGLIAIILGGVVGYFFLWVPYQEALRGDVVRISIQSVVLVPFCLVQGVFFTLFGNRVPYRTEVEGKFRFTPVGWVLMALWVLTSLPLILWYINAFKMV